MNKTNNKTSASPLCYMYNSLEDKKATGVLLALAKATNRSTCAHVPRRAIFLKSALRDRASARQGLRELVRMGLATMHPTYGEMTFHLTKAGLNLIRWLEYDNSSH